MNDLIGSTIAGCRIDSLLGEGGMGIVYKGRHIGLDIPVAVKILKPLTSGFFAEDRFLREARTAAQLRNAHIVGVLNVGSENGLNFIVMEYIDGPNLMAIVNERGKLFPTEATTIAIQILNGLQAAFEKGIVHRDIKPENILVEKNGNVKITDLGLARSQNDISMTQSGITLGSPSYIAPEQAENPRSADHRADIYSLGCTLFHMLSGSPPFFGTTPIEIILEHIRKPAPLLKNIFPWVPEALSDAVAKMMAKDPASRYQTPQEAREALEKALVLANRASSQIPAAPRAKRIANRIEKKRPRLPFFALLIAGFFAVAGIILILLSGVFHGKPVAEGKQIKTLVQTPPKSASPPAKTSGTGPVSRRKAPTLQRKTENMRTDVVPRPGGVLDAVVRGDNALLERLLDKGVSPNAVEGAATSPLHEAVYNRSARQVRMLLDKGANPSVRDKWGDCPLHYALRQGNFEIVRLLLDRGANPNIRDHDDFSPLDLADEQGDEEMIRLLKERGAN
jgi:predicted Ser/Thr protein kinase